MHLKMLKVTCDLSLFLKFLNCPVVDICYLFLLCMLFSVDKNPSFFFHSLLMQHLWLGSQGQHVSQSC